MAQAEAIKPSHRAIERYYQALRRLSGEHVTHELGLRSAFQNLLEDTAKLHGWSFIAELTVARASLPVASHGLGGRAAVRPDGTIRDGNSLPRGYWEAKDTHDALDAEIAKKKAKGYPLTNTIFEDTQTAVLYQNKIEVMRADVRDRQKLADLLNAFYRYAEPEIERFDHAVEEFKIRVPELARGLALLIQKAHAGNRKFEDAFSGFLALCQTAINPNLSRAAVDEMLVQHLLTERLFRTIFNNPEFTRRNAIAVEVEKVIEALASHAFNRDEFMRQLDPFYRAIEEAARTTGDFTEKQHFINTVYERFFQGYCVKVADTHGIVYTPQPIVDFMCASVAEVLEQEFGLPLGAPGVNILDPCVGTGNFIVNLMRRIPKKDLPRMYKEQLFANEIMLMPYYIAALNIEHAYYELTGEYEAFQGLCFVDTLEMAEHAHGQFAFMTEANTQRVERQKKTPITVIIGNPPYNAWQQNENDNNKNRKYKVIDQRIKETYAKDSAATNKNALSDMYVKFFRWATDRLSGQDGAVCFVSNNGFIDSISFDGMRKHLAADFQGIHVLDLKGNVRKDSMRDGIPIGEQNTIFGLSAMVGISVNMFVRRKTHPKPGIFFAQVDWRGVSGEFRGREFRGRARNFPEFRGRARNFPESFGEFRGRARNFPKTVPEHCNSRGFGGFRGRARNFPKTVPEHCNSRSAPSGLPFRGASANQRLRFAPPQAFSARPLGPELPAPEATTQLPPARGLPTVYWLLTTDYWLLTTDYWLLTTRPVAV